MDAELTTQRLVTKSCREIRMLVSGCVCFLDYISRCLAKDHKEAGHKELQRDQDACLRVGVFFRLHQ